jgi:hypothetical protein
MKLHQLWNLHGVIGRETYFLWGMLLFALKWNLDRFVFGWLPDGRLLSISDYLQAGFPAGDWLTVEAVREHGWTMLLPSLPFLWTGVVLTLQRLRSACLPLWLAVFFVVPVLKWFLFLAAALAPRYVGPNPPPHEGLRPPTWLERVCPRSRLGSALAGVAVSCALLLGATLLGTQGFRHYGWGLFVGLPFIAGFLAALFYGTHELRPLRESLLVALLAVLVAALGFVALAIEGVICIAMVAPLAVPLALVGAMLGHAVQPARRRQGSSQLLCAGILAVPLMLGSEGLADAPSPLLEVRSSLAVAAPPERVWGHVVAFTELPPPTEWLFRLGIAYPQRAEMFGEGPGAVRHCVFSTGPFVEPIEVWDEPRLLRFGVTKSPPPMEEWTPYQDVHPPHLDGFLASERGQFQLTALPNGGTRLEGTTWYRHNMWPVSYWQTWSDYIIHRIHLRVLENIKARAEAPVYTP